MGLGDTTESPPGGENPTHRDRGRLCGTLSLRLHSAGVPHPSCSVHPCASVGPLARDDGPDGAWAACARVTTLPAPRLACVALTEVRRLGRVAGQTCFFSRDRRLGREEEPSTLTGK